MRRFLLTAASVVVLAVFVGSASVTFFMPRQRPPTDITVDITPDLIERGTYLVEQVLLCNDCHSERDWSIYGGPPMPPFGAGWRRWLRIR